MLTHRRPQTDRSSVRTRPTTVRAVTTDATTTDPAQLRTALIDYIRGRNTFRTSRVENAFRTVPRHVFLLGVDLEAAYAPRPVVTKCADNGTAVSSASSPNLVAEMLELIDVQPGHRVLEIGAATGINAALHEDALAHALTHPVHEHWTGIQVHNDEPAEHLDLWLTTTSPSSFGRLSVGCHE